MKCIKHVSVTLLSFWVQIFEPIWAMESERDSLLVIKQRSVQTHCQFDEHLKYPWIAWTIGHPVPWESPETVEHPDVRVRIISAAPSEDALKVFESIDLPRNEPGMSGTRTGKLGPFAIFEENALSNY